MITPDVGERERIKKFTAGSFFLYLPGENSTCIPNKGRPLLQRSLYLGGKDVKETWFSSRNRIHDGSDHLSTDG